MSQETIVRLACAFIAATASTHDALAGDPTPPPDVPGAENTVAPWVDLLTCAPAA